MSKAFFVRCAGALLPLFLAVAAHGTPQRVRTSDTPVRVPAHTSNLGYVEILGRAVWVPVFNISRTLTVGQLKPMLQRNQAFYIGLYLYDDGYAEIFAVPRILSDGSGSAWVTQEHEIMFGRNTETRAGRFFFSPTEILPIIDVTDTEYVVTCERYDRRFPLRISKQTAGIRHIQELPRHVAAAMREAEQALVAASMPRRTQTIAPMDPLRPNLQGLNPQRRDDPDFVDPYPAPVLEVRRPPSQQTAEDPFMPIEVARATGTQPAPVPADADAPPAAPRVVRRHTIDGRADNLRLEMNTGGESGTAAASAHTAAAPPAHSRPGDAAVMNSKPVIEFTVPGQTSPAIETAPVEAPIQVAMAATPSPPAEPAATPPQEPEAEPAAEPEAEVEALAKADPPTASETSPSPSPSPFADSEPKAEKEAETLLAAVPGPPATETAKPSPKGKQPDETAAEIETLAAAEEPEQAEEPALEIFLVEAPEEKVETPELEEKASSLATLAVNMLIFFALLTAAFVVVVIALALFMNRRKSKSESPPIQPALPSDVKVKPSKKKAARQSAQETHDEAPPDIPLASSISESIDEEFEQPAAEEDSGTFTGSLESFSVPELIQFLNSSRETGMLCLEPPNDDIVCKLYFERGEIIDALSSSHTGEKAVTDILTMRDGLFSFTRQQEIETHRTVRQSTMSLLLQVQPDDQASPLSVP